MVAVAGRVVAPVRLHPRSLRTRGSAVEGRLGVDESLQLASVEEDAAALLALVDDHAAAFVLAHRTKTLRTGHLLLHLEDGT